MDEIILPLDGAPSGESGLGWTWTILPAVTRLPLTRESEGQAGELH